MKKLSVIILGKEYDIKIKDSMEVIYSDGTNLLKDVKKAQAKYVCFISDTDYISDDYFDRINEILDEDFDTCYINGTINYEYLDIVKSLKNIKKLNNKKPYASSYIWNYVFKKEKLLILLICYNEIIFNQMVDKLIEKRISINDITYYHNPKGKKHLKESFLVDKRKNKYYKNIIYIGNYASGLFNGYVSWLNNIGKCFKDYDITLLYDNLKEENLSRFKKLFRCIKYENGINYTCDRLVVTFSTYYYPDNIFPLEENYLFIHANMSDYENTVKYINYGDDIYTKYIAVSKTAALKAKGYFPTTNIEYIYNPLLIENVKPHLKLVSAQRSSGVKKMDRINVLAGVLDELDIPYTWNVFTDKNEGTNKNGLIFRNRVLDPLPYIEDADYFVLLSDSEAFSYASLEALCLNTKVIVTPLEVYDELGINDGENGFIIPFEYFDEENREKLKSFVLKIYENKAKEFNYWYGEEHYEGYKNIFK
ncbi:MAG: glycosyltransferase [Bacilli bacterium]|nr:glycosyltransferase [Bacilli bacterium]